MGVLLSRAPRDFHTGAKVTGDVMIERNVDDHHIFPHAYLAKLLGQANSREAQDSILNRGGGCLSCENVQFEKACRDAWAGDRSGSKPGADSE